MQLKELINDLPPHISFINIAYLQLMHGCAITFIVSLEKLLLIRALNFSSV